jgi:LacI family transcriptional regulator
LANISAGTVDRILHNRGQVSKKNIEIVNTIVEQYDYKRNIYASNLAFNKKYKIAVFIPKHEGVEYWEGPMLGIKKAAKEFEQFGVILEYINYKYNSAAFKKVSKKVLKEEYDGLIFAPIFYDESLIFLKEFKKKNIPIVMIDSNISEIEGLDYIGQDAYQSGYLAGKLISFGVKSENNILIMKITREIESTSVYLQRIKGFQSYFKENKVLSNYKFSEISIKDSEYNKLTKDMFKGINSVFVPNSRVYIIAKFIKENNLKDIRVVGYDLLKNNLDFLNDGTIDFLINQNPEDQGYLGVNHLYKKLVLKEEIEITNYIPLEIIVKENAVSFKKNKTV